MTIEITKESLEEMDDCKSTLDEKEEENRFRSEVARGVRLESTKNLSRHA